MKYFSFSDIIYALLCSSALGFIMGGIYNSLSALTGCVRKLLCVGIDAVRSPSISHCKSRSSLNKRQGASVNVYDFVFFLSFGAMHILLCYLTMDGVQRLYILIPSIITFIVSKNTVGAAFEKIIIWIYTPVYRILFILLFVITYPLRLIVCGMKILLTPLFKRIVLLINKTRINSLHRKNKRQIQRFFDSAAKI